MGASKKRGADKNSRTSAACGKVPSKGVDPLSKGAPFSLPGERTPEPAPRAATEGQELSTPGARLRRWRLGQGLSQAHAGRIVGVSGPSWCDWETDQKAPRSALTLLRLELLTGLAVETWEGEEAPLLERLLQGGAPRREGPPRDALRAWRKSAGLSQVHAGSLAGVSGPSWSDWEHGFKSPSGLLLQGRLQALTGVPVDAWFEGEEAETVRQLLQQVLQQRKTEAQWTG